MRYGQAVFKIALAGRELGSGPLEAVKRICPGLIEEVKEQRLANAVRVREDTQRRIEERADEPERQKVFIEVAERLGPADEDKILMTTEQHVYGVAVGRLMAEDPEAMQTLVDINEEWRRGGT